ncbi:Uncharacterised protein [uncultured archaeon]|nr:Uncharacterised protein [uncultured archaeon]
MKNTLKLVIVKWRDIKNEGAWTSKKDWATELIPPGITSVGFYVGEANDALYLAMDVDDEKDGDFGSLQCIPKGCILSVKHVTLTD